MNRTQLSVEIPAVPNHQASWMTLTWRCVAGSDFARKVASMFATQLGTIVLQITTTILIARMLGPAGRGRYAVAVVIGALAVRFITLGMHASNTYFVAKHRELLPKMLGNTVMYSLALGALTGVALWMFFRQMPALAPIAGGLLILSLLWVPFGLAYLLMQNLLIGIQEIRAYNLIELAGKGLLLAAIAAMALVARGTAEAAFSVGLLVVMVSLALAFRHLKKSSGGKMGLSLSLARQSLGVGFRAYLISLFGFMVLRIDLLMVQKIKGPYDSGNYSVASTMAENAMLLASTIGAVLFPKLSGMTDVRAKLKMARKAVLVTAAMMAPLLAVAALLAQPVVRMLFGEDFLPAAAAFVLLLPGILLLSIETVAVQFLNSLGYPRSVVIVWIFSALLNIVLNLWAIPEYGIRGASVVSSFTYITTSLLIFWIIMRHSRMMPESQKEEEVATSCETS